MSKSSDISNNNIDSSNNIIYPSIFNIDFKNKISDNHFFLESNSVCDINLWKNSFSYDSSLNLIINNKSLSKLLLNLKQSITGNLHFSGKSFSNKKLILGNIYLYYIQYISNCVFKVPGAFQPFMLNKKLKHSIFKFVDDLIDSFYDNKALDNFIKNKFTIDSSNNIIFGVTCIEFLITIPSNIINFGNKKINIPKTNWSINIIIGNKI